jgi:hypothetical protein
MEEMFINQQLLQKLGKLYLGLIEFFLVDYQFLELLEIFKLKIQNMKEMQMS